MNKKSKSNKPSLALRAAAIQQHMSLKMFSDPIIKPKMQPVISDTIIKPKKTNVVPSSTIFESHSVSDKHQKYQKSLTLAEKMGLVNAPPPPLTDEQFETVKITAQRRGFYNETCPICMEPFGPDNIVLLSCSHLLHATCLMSFRKFSSGKQHLCPVCRQPYEFVEVNAESEYCTRCALRIQRVIRGYLVRKDLGEIAPQGTSLHRKWILARAHHASNQLIVAIENQSDAVDAFLGSIDHDLEWARSVMKEIEEKEKVVNWAMLIAKAIEKGLEECPVCLRQMLAEDSSITSCGHVFHTQCINSWVQFCNNSSKPSSCPVCRSVFQLQSLIPSSDDPSNNIPSKKPIKPRPRFFN